jgi:hypothetical protein
MPPDVVLNVVLFALAVALTAALLEGARRHLTSVRFEHELRQVRDRRAVPVDRRRLVA